MESTWNNERLFSDLMVETTSDGLRVGDGDFVVDVVLGAHDISRVDIHGGPSIFPSDAKRITVGQGNAERVVNHYLVPGGLAPRLRLGVTHHVHPGGWSSLPHSFELNPELGFEEFFFYMVRGHSELAWQRGKGVFYDGTEVDDFWPVRDRTFSTIPMGFHPVVGEPGVDVSYVWAYLVKMPHWEKI